MRGAAPGRRAVLLARVRGGLERLTCGSGAGRAVLPPLRAASQARGIVRSEEPASVHPSLAIAPVRTPLVTPVLQGAESQPSVIRATGADNGRLLSVRETAHRLGVCTATVYTLCDAGRLAHVRVRNAIRVAPQDLATFVRAHRHGRPVHPRSHRGRDHKEV
jgi:excisionase family DNA binding protein